MRKITTILAIVVISLVIILPVWYCATMEAYDLYIIDKGYAMSYVDEYSFRHDEVFWIIAGNNENTYTIFVPPHIWYNYAVGEIYHGSMSQYLIYKGDDGIARYLGGESSDHP